MSLATNKTPPDESKGFKPLEFPVDGYYCYYCNEFHWRSDPEFESHWELSKHMKESLTQ